MKRLNIEAPENSSYPSDPYEEHRKELASRMVSSHPRDVTHTLKKFLEHDRHVLRFYCLWDDSLSMFGEARRMVMHYFLADDTVEIFEQVPHNSGRDRRSTGFLRRGKLPKDPSLFHPESPNPHIVDYFTDRDFEIGTVIPVYGRKFVICDCDEFTRNHYLDNGITLEDPITFNEHDDGNILDAMTNIPPYNGYGSEEDSMGSCTSLIPKPPKKDFKKLMAFDRVVLRFESSLVSNRPVDHGRRFII